MGAAENENISAAQKELLKWHWKVVIGMYRIQEMMCECHYDNPDGGTTILPAIIQPKNPSARNCIVPPCHFLHADLEPGENVYVDMPLDFSQYSKDGTKKCLKLKKTLYGLRQSPRAFWKYITQKLETCGLEQSKFDPCLFKLNLPFKFAF